MDDFIIRSSDSSGRIRFFHAPDHRLGISEEYVSVEIVNLSYRAVIKVFLYRDGSSLVSFFEWLADHWSGWENKKSWASIEEELVLECSSDQTGHVFFDVILQQAWQSSEPWLVKARINTDTGQLKSIAKSAREFFNP